VSRAQPLPLRTTTAPMHRAHAERPRTVGTTRVRATYECKHCGERFVRIVSLDDVVRKRCCSVECANAAMRSSNPRTQKRKPMILSTKDRGFDAEYRRLRKLLVTQAYGTPCPFCALLMLPEDSLSLDHIVPRAWGGKSIEGNLRVAHYSCNSAQGYYISSRCPPGRRRTA
jgi:5-methylcytosine-specific restriction endonuclease McrA